jgi:hypothetical protein
MCGQLRQEVQVRQVALLMVAGCVHYVVMAMQQQLHDAMKRLVVKQLWACVAVRRSTGGMGGVPLSSQHPARPWFARKRIMIVRTHVHACTLDSSALRQA